jgi:hypothetical protein
MSEIRTVEDVHRFLAEYDRANPPPCPVEARQRELAAERERQVRKAREAEEKQRAASTSWYAAVDGRVHEHLQNWLWNAIDERIREHIKIARKPMVDATGGVLGQFRAQLREELKQAIEEAQDVVAAKLAEQKERFLATPGRLPVAKIWRLESVTYEGEVVSYEGTLYQARKDTAQSPGGSDSQAFDVVIRAS